MLIIGHFETNFREHRINFDCMKKQKEIIVYAVFTILKATLSAAAWVGRSRIMGLKLIGKMSLDEKDKEIVFLRDRIYQLETQITIFQKQIISPPGKFDTI